MSRKLPERVQRKEMAIGFAVGLIANGFGTLITLLLFDQGGIGATWQAALREGQLGSLIALGAILNLFAFFGFLRIRRDLRARGVLFATILVAVAILLLKLF